MKDFPPAGRPERPAGRGQPAEAQSGRHTPVPRSAAPAETLISERPEPYLLGVGDEFEIVAVLGQPDLLPRGQGAPDGAHHRPGAGTVFALGRSPEEVGHEIQTVKLADTCRHPVVNLLVDRFRRSAGLRHGGGDRAGGIPYYQGMSRAPGHRPIGGLQDRAPRPSSVVVLRRTGGRKRSSSSSTCGAAVKKGDASADMALRPFDIVYVPRSFIANVGCLRRPVSSGR